MKTAMDYFGVNLMGVLINVMFQLRLVQMAAASCIEGLQE